MISRYTLKKGLELFGEETDKATVNELKQIHDKDTYKPIGGILSGRESKRKSNDNDVDNVKSKDKKGDTYDETHGIIFKDILVDQEEIKGTSKDDLPLPPQ